MSQPSSVLRVSRTRAKVPNLRPLSEAGAGGDIAPAEITGWLLLEEASDNACGIRPLMLTEAEASAQGAPMNSGPYPHTAIAPATRAYLVASFETS